MLRHQYDPGHERLDVPGCFACRVSHVQMAPSATPSRRGGAEAAHRNALETRWDKDMAAYKRLVREGHQPYGIDGIANVEREATTTTQIEHGIGSPPDLAERKGLIE